MAVRADVMLLAGVTHMFVQMRARNNNFIIDHIIVS